ncbi:MAG: hypothetical protein U0470_10300 [Anaerolineae bacterium]
MRRSSFVRRRPPLALACLPALALVLSACLVRDDLDDPPPPGRPPVPIRVARPFARLRIDPIEATFERRDADLNVFLRCTAPFWAKRRRVEVGIFEATGGTGGNSLTSVDCPGPELPVISEKGNSFSDVAPGDPVWVGLDVARSDGARERVMRGFVMQPDGRLEAVPESAATPAWWRSYADPTP